MRGIDVAWRGRVWNSKASKLLANQAKDVCRRLVSAIYSEDFESRTPRQRIRSHYLSASIGETRVARLAGMKHAANVTIASSTGTTANVVGSLADTPNRRLDISRVTTIDAPSPTMVPVAAEFLSALADDEGHHAIDPQRGEQQRRHSKDGRWSPIRWSPCDPNDAQLRR